MKDKKMQEKDKINLQLKNMKKLKEQGITLIALVVTIILLLILAGVTISQIAGSNGLFQRARQAVEKYKNAAEEEQIQIGMLEQYVSDFSVVVGNEGENKASITIKTFTVEGNPKEQTIKVNLEIEGEASKIQLSIDNGKTWEPSEEEKLEETEGAYTYTFEGLDLGKSYYVRVKVCDEEGKYVEAISDIVTLSNEMTATVEDVLETKTFLAKDGSVLTGQMKNNGVINEKLSAGDKKEIPVGYTSGGTITVKSLKELTPGDAKAGDILNGKKAWVEGTQLTGSMPNKSGQTVTASSVNNDGQYTILTIPESGYYQNGSKIRVSNEQISTLAICKSKNLTNSGLQVYDNRVSIIEGGYFDDVTYKKVYIYIKMKANIDFYNTSWCLVSGIPHQSSSEYIYIQSSLRGVPFLMDGTYLCAGRIGDGRTIWKKGGECIAYGIYDY